MFIVCVAACPTGIAHTYMAAEALETVGKELGYEIKVETQGSMGLDNEITQEDIARASGVIIAADVTIRGMERFKGLTMLECAVADPIKHGKEVFSALLEEIHHG